MLDSSILNPSIMNVSYLPTLERLGLALCLGLFVGLERERRHKEAGLRTFAFAALQGSLGGLLGESYALMSIALLGVLITFLNLQTLRNNQGTELTTSAALLVTGFAGVLCGLGHTLTPAAVAIITAALLAWKEPLAGFILGLRETELRSAILLAIFAFVIYPALPPGPIGPWGLIEPRAAWITVILIAGIGFVNYTLWNIYGNRGMELAGFLGGLVNSTVTVSELADHVGELQGGSTVTAYRGILYATAAMILRNLVLLFILAPLAVLYTLGAFVFMLISGAVIILWPEYGPRQNPAADVKPSLSLTSPFSLKAALKYGVLFLGLQILGTLTRKFFGHTGVYVTSMIGGFLSSASAVAAAASLAAKGTISYQDAGTCTVIASLTSVLTNLPFVLRSGNQALTRRLTRALSFLIGIGVVGVIVQVVVMPHVLTLLKLR
jgi:uncharacterized membrane protein (DUF4010 family)